MRVGKTGMESIVDSRRNESGQNENGVIFDSKRNESGQNENGVIFDSRQNESGQNGKLVGGVDYTNLLPHIEA